MKDRTSFIARLSFVLAVLALLSSAASAQTFDAVKKQVRTFTLPNGMKFIVLERHNAPIAAFHVHADVGSANESYGITGISHILEHMAAKGTKTIGTKDYAAEAKALEAVDAAYAELRGEEGKAVPDPAKVADLRKKFDELDKKAKEFVVNNEYWDMMKREGDAGFNAGTSNDHTQYTSYLPSNKLEFWMAMTSDRFLNPVFREFYKERDVVQEERRLIVETQPMGRLQEDFLAVAFKAHPYHHYVIGHMSDLQSITRKDVEDYFKKFYGPSNLTVGIVGDVKADEVFRLAETYFGRIPSGPRPEPIRTKEPEQWGERRVAVSAKSQPILIIGYHVPEAKSKDTRAIEALANILGQGQSSRLSTALVKDKKVAAKLLAQSGFPGDKFLNLFTVIVMPAAGKTAAECLAAIEEEIETIKKDSVTEDELTKFKRSSIKSALDKLSSNRYMAALLTYADVVLGDYGKAFDQIDEIKALKAEDIKRVANQYLVKNNRTIGEIVPEKREL
jgi:predicted Zn-dependent peptidase